MGNAEEAEEIIPQLVWAVISASRDFFSVIRTRDDVDTPEGEPANVAIANLHIPTQMFKAGFRLNLANVPNQWTKKQVKAPVKPQPQDTCTKGQDRRQGVDPFRRSAEAKKASGANPNQPETFKKATPLQQLRERISGITLSDITFEAGFRRGPSSMDTTGFPEGACLNWICMGDCSRPGCLKSHPEQVDEAAAVAVYTQMEPGIKRLLQSGKKPRRGN
jgi:hypothetical protein